MSSQTFHYFNLRKHINFSQDYFKHLPDASDYFGHQYDEVGHVYFVSNGQPLKCNNISWLGLSHFHDEFPHFNVSSDNIDRYILSFYYSCQVLVGVGYGDLFSESVSSCTLIIMVLW